MGRQKARGTEGARGTKEPGAWQLCLVGPVDTLSGAVWLHFLLWMLFSVMLQ